MTISRRFVLIAGGVLAVLLLAYLKTRPEIPLLMKLQGRNTRADWLAEFRTQAQARLLPAFAAQGLSYPPERVVLLGLKRERRLEVHAGASKGPLVSVRSYTVLGASGDIGPKLREGDRQVPEGVYRVESLNPNSSFHLSIKLDYPNAFDQRMARQDGRQRLGGDIFIHGGRGSVGCLAMGDPAIEELFMLVADTGEANVEVLLAPQDLRSNEIPQIPSAPGWLPQMYGELQHKMQSLSPSEQGGEIRERS